MKIKRLIILTLFFLIIGFAAVATNLSLKGTSMFGANIDDFDVYFSAAIIDGEDYSNEVISNDKKTITFNIDEFKYVGDTSTLVYQVTNASTSYDAEVRVECEGVTEEIGLEQNPNEHIIKAREVVEGTVTIRLNRKVIEEKEIEYTCRLVVNAIERESIDESLLAVPDTYIIEGNYVDEEGNPISNANLVIYSEEPHYVMTDSKGYLFNNKLEKGAHEIYYVDDTLENIKKMSKEEVIKNSISSTKFTTSTAKEIIFSDNSKVLNAFIISNKAHCEPLIGNAEEFSFSGNYQEFFAKCAGIYKIELWGGSAGGVSNGAYTSGFIGLDSNKLFVYVGGGGSPSNTILTGGYNGGGGSSRIASGTASGPTGGGATDIRLVNGEWNNFDSLKSRIMVAAGGGGSYVGGGGQAGGINGYDGNSTVSTYYPYLGRAATQTSTGALPAMHSCATSNGTVGGFGFGGSGGRSSNSAASGGGGGAGSGYYGGSGASGLCNGIFEAGGGSSFISGHNGCNAIAVDSTTSKIVHTGQSNHYSGYVFTDTVMIDGAGYSWTTAKGSTVVGMPTHDGSGTMTGNSGNGYAKITLVSLN